MPGLNRLCIASPQANQRGRGFTLIELLVVVAVIAILASLLLPALARARQASHNAVCKNNLRQWGLSLRIYLNDYGVFPPVLLDDGPGPNTWHDRLVLAAHLPPIPWDYNVSDPVPNKNIQFCPGTSGIPFRHTYLRRIGTYGYNGSGVGSVSPNPSGLGGTIVFPPNRSFPNNAPENFLLTREEHVVAPANMIAIADAIIGTGFWGYADQDGWNTMEILNPYYAEVSDEFGTFGPPLYTKKEQALIHTAVQRRHAGRWNTLFCDGHTELLRTAELFDIRKNSLRKRWNASNTP